MARVNRRFFSKNEELATKAYADSAFTAARTYTDTKVSEAKTYAESLRDEAMAYTDDLAEAIMTDANLIKYFDSMPEPGEDWENQIVQYTGPSDGGYVTGHTYQCVYDSNNNYYYWKDLSVGEGNILPTPSEQNVGQIIQYTGLSEEGLVNGYFYECVYDETHDEYYWKQIQVQPGDALDYITNAEIDEMFAEPVEGADLTLSYGATYMDETQNPIAILNNEILFDENLWRQDGDPEEHGWMYYAPNSEDIMKITFSYEDLEIVAPYDNTEIDQYYENNKWNYAFYFGDVANYLADIFARTNNSLNGVTVNIRIQPGVLTIDGELNGQINKTFIYGQPVEGNSYPILTIDKSELTFITSEGEGQDQVDIYKIPETSKGYVNYYYVDKPNGDVVFYNSAPMFPLHVIDEGITYSIEAEWTPENDTGYGHGNYVVEAHKDLPEYLNDWVEWGVKQDPDTGDNTMVAIFGKSWDRS